ncbi:hypothetical protein [Facklamia sp. 7083-14-GEN3]|uniref:hypothetical protein n=1 Tax=Facklamia sp. 7083-14-GEN3 TaxID=2973478 RepID=UPI00215C84F2|nr:hypothetical protein [Facklamia sp. 7083-14-GEN3]MCR8968777.1 hypothetical protein [Facklamia sp. 7083-14-GEN3]
MNNKKGDCLQNTKQWLDHRVDLSSFIEKVSQDQINQLVFKLILFLPPSLIATDIRSGFPQLISIERDTIKDLLSQRIALLIEDHSLDLSDWHQLNDVIDHSQRIITNYYQDHSLIDLDSIQVEVNYFLK